VECRLEETQSRRREVQTLRGKNMELIKKEIIEREGTVGAQHKGGWCPGRRPVRRGAGPYLSTL